MASSEPVELVTTAGGEPEPVAVGFAANVDAVCVILDEASATHAPDPSARRPPSGAHILVRGRRCRRRRSARPGIQSSHLGGWPRCSSRRSQGSRSANRRPTSPRALRRVRELGTARCLARALEGVFAVTLGDDDTRGVERLKDLIERRRGRRAAGEHRGRRWCGRTRESSMRIRARPRSPRRRGSSRGIPATGADVSMPRD